MFQQHRTFQPTTEMTLTTHFHLSMLGDLRRSAEPPVTLSDWHRRRRAAVYGQCRLVTVVARSRQLAATIPNFVSHELYSRTKFLLFEATENFSSFYCNSEETQPHCNIALPP